MKNKLIILAVLLALGLSGCGTHTDPNLPRDTLPGDFMTETTAESETETITAEQTSEAVTTAETTKETEPVTTAPDTTALPENSEIVWSDDNYKLIAKNTFYYTLYDKDMNELYDYGYVDSSYKPKKVTSADGKLTILFDGGGLNWSDLELHYPQGDLNVGEVFYQENGFELRHSDDGWFAKMPERNYLFDLNVKSEKEPIYGKYTFTDANEDVTTFVWLDTGDSFRVNNYSRGYTCEYGEKFNQTYEWNGYTVITDGWTSAFVLDKTGKIALYAGDGTLEPFGNMLHCFYNSGERTKYHTFYNTELKPITDSPLCIPSLLGDGSLVGIVDNHFESFDADGKLTKQSRDYDCVFTTVYSEKLADYGAFVLVKDGGKLKLVDTDENVITEFKDYKDDWIFHWMLSGYYEKTDTEAPPAYYFVFEDGKTTNEDGIREVEFWYAPDTGKSGVYETYSSFAYAKPVLYLYPEETTDVTVKFEHPERLTTVYPAYNDGWTVTASPDGNLFDGRRNYYALYWEENSNFMPDFRTGFIVDGDYAEFLEEKLDKIGLTEREANEFIMYWLPILEKNGRSVVWFELTESRETGNKLHISPEPDSLLRVAIHIKRADSKTKVTEQVLPHFDRKGFTVVEWGGRVYE